MATIEAVILKHQKKQNGTYEVKYRLFHNKRSVYIKTGVTVGKSNLDTKNNLKKSYIEAKFANKLTELRDKIAEVNKRGVLQYKSIEEIRDILFDQHENRTLDFYDFAEEVLEKKKQEGKIAVAAQYRTIINSLKDYAGVSSLPFDSINSLFLRGYEQFLSKPRYTVRPKKNGGKTKAIKREGVTKNGIIAHMSIIRNIFNQARFKYNDEDLGIIRISHYPFRKYLIPTRVKTAHRNLQIEDIVRIAKLEIKSRRTSLARDLFLLSFMLCGMNARDMYGADWVIDKNGRYNYYRNKTKDKRVDSALMSVKIPEAALQLIKSANEATKRYSNHLGLNTGIAFGIRDIGENLGIEKLTFYHARHSFATIARNDCRCSKDDVAMALNHVDQSLRVTDTYIAKDWGIVDEVQGKVLKLFFDKLNQTV